MLPAPAGWGYIRVAPGLHGRGLFAAVDLPRGQRVMEYRGEKVTRGEGTRRTERQWAKGRIYVFNLSRRFDLDGSPAWNKARLANHSCEPNCESQNERGRRIWVVAKRRIRAGEELTYDYHFDFVDPPPPCHCGSPRCRGFIVGPHDTRKLKAWLKEKGRPLPPGLRPRSRKATASPPAPSGTPAARLA